MDDIKTQKPKPSRPPDSGLVLILKQQWASPEGRWRTIGLGVSMAVLIALYWENLKHFTFVWSNDDNYSHGWLVAPLCIFFANQAAQQRSRSADAPSHSSGLMLGLLLIVAGLCGRLVTVFLPIGLVADGSLIVCLAGVIALICGTETFKKYAFSIGFLVFMIPLPVALYTMLANPLQLVVSKVASVVMTTAGIPVLCEGNMMTLPGDIRMFVAEACSGMRQLTGFLALTAAVAYLSGKPIWYRIILIASAIPVAMVANIARVIVTGLVMYYVDPNYAKGAWHTVEGMALMMAGLALLQLEMGVLNALMEIFAAPPVPAGSSEAKPESTLRSVVKGAQA